MLGRAGGDGHGLVNDVDLILFDQAQGRAALHELLSRWTSHSPVKLLR
jgi:hypothetical protein